MSESRRDCVFIANEMNRVFEGAPSEEVLAALAMIVAQFSMDKPSIHIDATMVRLTNVAKAYHLQCGWGAYAPTERPER